MKKLLNETFKDISKESFFRVWLRWVIDSKYRTQKQVDLFLKEQLSYPSEYMMKLARSLRCDTQDETVVNVLKWVTNQVKYKFDKDNFGKTEYWATAEETINRKFDDCDGINGAIYILSRLAGISPLKIWCALGDTSSGYHFWCMYFSTETDHWYSIDGTFYTNFKEISQRIPFCLNKAKYNKICYLFNDEVSYKQ